MHLWIWVVYHDESDTFEVWAWDNVERVHHYDLESPHNKTYADALAEVDRIMRENPNITWERKSDEI